MAIRQQDGNSRNIYRIENCLQCVAALLGTICSYITILIISTVIVLDNTASFLYDHMAESYGAKSYGFRSLKKTS